MSEPDTIRCETWRERLTLARRQRPWGLLARSVGFTRGDRALSRDPTYCLLGEAALRIGLRFEDLLRRAQGVGLYDHLLWIETQFMSGLQYNRYREVERAIDEIEALLPSLRRRAA